MTDFTATTSPAIFETNGSTNTWRVSNVGVEGPAGETFPTQTGNGGAVLGTNGTATSWARSFTSPDGETVISTYDGGGGLDWDGAGGAYAYADVDSVEGAFITAGDGVSESATVKAKSDGTIALVSTGAATLNSHALVVDTDARLTDARTPTAHKSSHATGGGDALSPSDIGAVPTSSLGMQVVIGPGQPTAAASTSVTITYGGSVWNGGYTHAGGSVNNYREYGFGCLAGTYSIEIAYVTNAECGIISISLDGGSALGTTIDTYSAGVAFRNATTITGISLSGGTHTIRLTVASKNASASNYFGYVCGIRFVRTGA